MGKCKLKAQLTIMAAMVFALIISLMAVLIESAVNAASKTKISSAVNLGVQSLFSQYSRPLLENYEVFGGVIHEDEEVIRNLYENISKNITWEQGISLGFYKKFDPYAIKILGINISEKEMLTDRNGDLFYEEITGYMTYGMFENDLTQFLPDMTQTAGKESIEAVSEELEERQKEAWKIDEKVLKLLMYIEGVKTTSSGFSQFFGKLSAKSNFVKKICPNGTGFGETGVDNRKIYDAVSGKYYDITDELNDLKGELDLIIAVYNNPLTKGRFIDFGFRNCAGDIVDEIEATADYVEKSLKLIEDIEKGISNLSQNLTGSKQVLNNKKGDLTESVAKAYEQEFQEMEKYSRGEVSTLCDLEVVKQQLMECQMVLQEMHSAVSGLAGCDMDINSIGSVYGMVDSCIEVCKQYNAAAIKFDYSGVTLGKGESISVLESIRNVFTQNIYKLVIEDQDSISDKKINYKDLSSEKCLKNHGKWEFSLEPDKLYKDFLYNRYVNLYFSNYLNANAGGLLEYEMEYILGKKSSDKENLKETINQLYSLRYASNFAYIICDTGKKNECYNTALSMLGFTGSQGVIKLGQFILLAAWAHAESINDVKILMDGGKVPVVKDSNSWKTSLSDVVEKNVKKSGDKNTSGLEYNQYLQLLLFLENKEKKIFRTMDMIEVNMIKKGYSHIRMYNYLYSLKGSVQFRYRNGKYNYQQQFEFSY